MPKKIAEPIGTEISINVKAVPELKSAAIGSTCCVKIKGTIMGKHTHSVGTTEKMVDLRIDEMEYEEEDGEEESEEKDEKEARSE